MTDHRYSRIMAYLQAVLRRPLALNRAVMRIRSRSTIAVHGGGVRTLEDMPGPKGWPVLGCLLEVIRDMRAGNSQDESIFHRNHVKYGPIYKMKILNTTLVSVATPEAAPIVVRGEGEYPSRFGRKSDSNMMWIYNSIKMPQSIGFSGGPEWKKLRSAASKQIIPRRVANYTDPLNKCSLEFADHLATTAEKGNGLIPDVLEEVVKFTLQASVCFIFGEKLNTYTEENEDMKEYIEAVRDGFAAIPKVANVPPIYKLFPTKGYRQFTSATKRAHKVSRRIMSKHLERAVAESVDNSIAVSMMEQWLIEGKITKEEVLMLSYDVLGGGIDTATNTITFMFHELAKNPEAQESIYEEIRSVMGERTAPTFEDFQKMPLVRGCVKETLRLYPIGTYARELEKPIEVLGYYIPAGVQVIHNNYTCGRNPDYVEDPLSFKPERWSRDQQPRLNSFVSIPFGIGPRGCYGRRLAELELFCMLAQVVSRFRLTTTQRTVKTTFTAVLKPSEPVSIHFSLR